MADRPVARGACGLPGDLDERGRAPIPSGSIARGALVRRAATCPPLRVVRPGAGRCFAAPGLGLSGRLPRGLARLLLRPVVIGWGPRRERSRRRGRSHPPAASATSARASVAALRPTQRRRALTMRRIVTSFSSRGGAPPRLRLRHMPGRWRRGRRGTPASAAAVHPSLRYSVRPKGADAGCSGQERRL